MQNTSVPAAETLPTNELDCTEEAQVSQPPCLSEAQLTANRLNAQFSTGPRTATGKAKSSLNAVKTGLTGRTVLLPCDDAAEYERFIQAYEKEFSPVGQREADLVQSIADSMWRLRRIPGLEAAIYAQGSLEFAEMFNHHDPSVRSGMIELRTFLTYEKQFRNLQLQESRLHRRYQKDTAELHKLQDDRKTKRLQALDTAARQYILAQHRNRPFDLEVNGFEFSTAEIERYVEGVPPSWIDRYLSEQERRQALMNPKSHSQAA